MKFPPPLRTELSNPALRAASEQRKAREAQLKDLCLAAEALHTTILKVERKIDRHERLKRYRRHS